MRLLPAYCVLILAALTGCASTHHQARGTARVSSAERSTFAVARLHEKQRSFDRAATAYQELAVEHPENYQPLHRLGVIAIKQGQLAEGIIHLEEAAKLAADNVDVVTDLGYAQFLNGDLEEAVETYQSALAIEPANERASVNLGLALAHLGRDEQALSTLRSVSSSAEALTSLAYVYSQKGDRQRAEEYFHRAIDEDNSHAPASEGLIQLAKAEQNRSAGNGRNLPKGISVVAVRAVNEQLRTAEFAGHSLSDVASGSVKPAGLFDVALAQSHSKSGDHTATSGNASARSVPPQPIQTIGHEESVSDPLQIRHADAVIDAESDHATRDSLLTVLKYGGPEAQITAIYDLVHLKLVNPQAASAVQKLSESDNPQVADVARDALQIAQTGTGQ